VSREIFLVRHGEALVPWSQGGNSGLSEIGKQQAEEVSASLSHLHEPQLISSPLLRALETGSRLSKFLGIELIVDDRYCEVPLSLDLEVRKSWLRNVSSMRWCTMDDRVTRWRSNAWTALMELHQDSVIFTHFMLINALLSRATSNENLVCFEPNYGSITRLRISNAGDCEVVSLGQPIAAQS